MKTKYIVGLLVLIVIALTGCGGAIEDSIESGAADDPPTVQATATAVPTEAEPTTPPEASMDDADAGEEADPAAESETWGGFTEGGDPFHGDPDAPVLIEEFSSYQCPYCSRFIEGAYRQVLDTYVETGQARYVFRDFPLSGQRQSGLAAEAANCAGNVAGVVAYWAMHDWLFGNQRAWSGRGDASDIFKTQAAELDVEAEPFADCLDSHATQAEVEADAAEGAQRGVRGTPSFFINGEPLVGAQPFEAFAAAIDRALAGGGAPPESAGPYPTPTPATIASVEAYRTLGDPEAPITLVEFSDYQCPYCRQHFLQVWPLIKKNFIDTGKVRYVFKDFPLTSIHPQAVLAHQAARCAGEQNAYWEMHDQLYEQQQDWSGQENAAGRFATYADDLGLDRGAFTECLDSERWQTAVGADLNEGLNLGVTGTPAFFIDGYPISGAQPYELFEFAFGLAEEGTLGDAYQPRE